MKFPFIKIVLTFLILSNIVHAQWMKVEPIRKLAHRYKHKLIDDLEEKMPEKHIYRHQDITTHAHETTHGLNSHLRQGYKDGYNVFYVFNGKCFGIEEPPIKLNDVARQIPREYRDNIYDLYLINAQQWWNDSPLYVLEEWVAYTNGTIVGHFAGSPDTAYSFVNTLKFTAYTYYLEDLACNECYDSRNLRTFLRWQRRRVKLIYRDGVKKGWITRRHTRIYNKIFHRR